MKRIKNIIFSLFFCFSLFVSSGCSKKKGEILNGHEMGVKINDVVYEMPIQASTLVDRGLLFNNMKFESVSGEDYLYNGTSTIPEFMVKYEFDDDTFLDDEHCRIVGITSDLYGNKTPVTTPEGFGLDADFEELKKTYGEPDINIDNDIYIYLNKDHTYCYIFEEGLFYCGTINEKEIENYKNME